MWLIKKFRKNSSGYIRFIDSPDVVTESKKQMSGGRNRTKKVDGVFDAPVDSEMTKRRRNAVCESDMQDTLKELKCILLMRNLRDSGIY